MTEQDEPRFCGAPGGVAFFFILSIVAFVVSLLV